VKQRSTYIVEELKKVNIVRLGTEVCAKDMVDGTREHHAIVDGDGVYLGDAVVAGLTAAGYRGVHEIVYNEEIGLELRGT